MYRYERLLVPIGFKGADVAAIRYAAMVCRMAGTRQVRFVHVSRGPEVPDWLHKKFPELVETTKAAPQERLRGLVKSEFRGDDKTSVEYTVAEGNPVVELLRQVRDDEADLVLVGRGRHRREAGSMGERLARKAPCSVLVVPEGAEARLSSVVVAVDFSSHCKDALDVATAFAAAAESGAPRVYGLNVYSVPIGFHKTGKTYEDFAQIVKQHAASRFADFVRPLDLRGISVEPTFLLDPKPANGIQRAAEVLRADLIVTGARGRGAGAAVLLGSVTEHLIATTNVPLLAAKKKGEGMSFLDALLNL